MLAKTFRTAAMAAAAIVVFSGPAQATPVSPGSDLSPVPGITYAANNWLGGTVIADELVSFSFTDPYGKLISGQIQDRVVKEDAAGTLDFYWGVRVDANSQGPVSYFRIGNFDDANFDTYYRPDSSGSVAPYSAYRFGGASSSFMNFSFEQWNAATGGYDQPLVPGTWSDLMLIHTDATSYAKTALMDVAGTGTGSASMTFATFTPAVPEPETYALMLAGLGLIGFIARQRKAV